MPELPSTAVQPVISKSFAIAAPVVFPVSGNSWNKSFIRSRREFGMNEDLMPGSVAPVT
jgi:hypothetical protein